MKHVWTVLCLVGALAAYAEPVETHTSCDADAPAPGRVLL